MHRSTWKIKSTKCINSFSWTWIKSIKVNIFSITADNKTRSSSSGIWIGLSSFKIRERKRLGNEVVYFFYFGRPAVTEGDLPRQTKWYFEENLPSQIISQILSQVFAKLIIELDLKIILTKCSVEIWIAVLSSWNTWWRARGNSRCWIIIIARRRCCISRYFRKS